MIFFLDYAKITKRDEDCNDDVDSDDEIDESTFLQRIERKVNKYHLLCIPKVEQKVRYKFLFCLY